MNRNREFKLQRLFTSHYVSINSLENRRKKAWLSYLHPTMYLLIQYLFLLHQCILSYLHPTMYLLIHCTITNKDRIWVNLHPTMYLLIRVPRCYGVWRIHLFTSHYVSINSKNIWDELSTQDKFTSHYVSINSVFHQAASVSHLLIYIPLCIY